MAGTRLVLQTLVMVQLVSLACFSLYRGFCTDTCRGRRRTKGNLTKDLPLVPGLLPGTPHGRRRAVVQPQWWEDALCHPLRFVLQSLQLVAESNDGGNETETSETSSSLPPSQVGFSSKLIMTLAVETVPQLPQWMDLVARGLQQEEKDGDGDETSNSSFEALLASNPMDVQILPPSVLPDHHNTSLSSAVWSHYKNHGQPSHPPPQRRLVVYIPAWMPFPEDQRIEWKAFDVVTTSSPTSHERTSTTTTTTTTMVHPSKSSSTSTLQPLIEDWMARSILAQQQQQQQQPPQDSSGQTSTTKNNARLTREFPIEHFLAVLMPLLFPLLLPFTVSWIKEYKRYRELTAAKKVPPADNNEPEKPLTVAAKTKTE